MTRALARVLFLLAVFLIGQGIICLLTHPAHAAGDAPSWVIWPPERDYSATVIEVTCQQLRDCCGIDRACGGYATGPLPVEPAPVTLSWPGLMLAAALGLLWRMR